MKRLILIMGLASSSLFAATFPTLPNQTAPADGDFLVGYRSTVDSRFQLLNLWTSYYKAKADAVYAPLVHTHTLANLSQSGATSGQVPVWNGSAWLPGTPATSGSGDFSSNTSTSVDSELVLFSGTAGKTGKRATGTGVAHIASGVLSASNVNLASEVTGVLPQANIAALTDKISFGFDGGGSVLTTAAVCPITIPYACTITGWKISSPISGTLSLSVKKGTPSGGTYTAAAIDGGAGPSLTSQKFNSASSVGAWTPALAAGDVVEIVITGTPAGVTQVSGVLTTTRAY